MSRGRSSDDPLRGITRFEYGRSVLWWVRFQRGKSKGTKTVTSATFSDKVWGGKRKALKAAQLWRNRTERELEAPILPNPEKPPGYGYVKRSVVQQRVGQSDVWIAWLRVRNRRCKATKISIDRWGNAEAKRLAEQWLIDKRKELGLSDPEKKRRPPPAPHRAPKPITKKRAKKKAAKKRSKKKARR